MTAKTPHIRHGSVYSVRIDGKELRREKVVCNAFSGEWKEPAREVLGGIALFIMLLAMLVIGFL